MFDYRAMKKATCDRGKLLPTLPASKTTTQCRRLLLLESDSKVPAK